MLHSRSVTAAGLPESLLADPLRTIQAGHAGVDFGSYPITADPFGVSVVARSEDAALAEAGIEAVSQAMRALGFEPLS